MSRIVVREHRPGRTIVLFLVAIAVSSFATMSYLLPRQSAVVSDPADLDRQVAQFEADAAASRAEVTRMQHVVSGHVRARQVEEQAYAEIERHLVTLQTQVLALEEEVAFYRGIVATSKEQELKIRRLFIFHGSKPAAYRFQVVLTRNVKDDKVLAGSVSISIVGESDGESRKIPAESLLGWSDGKLDFSFRYFHKLEGQFELPLDFVPHRIIVRVTAPKGASDVTEKAFNWVVETG